MIQKINIENIFDYGDFDNEPIKPNNLTYLFVILLFPLCYIGQLILSIFSDSDFFYSSLEWLVMDKIIPPFSTGNYAHAQYQNWIDNLTYPDSELFNRWNLL